MKKFGYGVLAFFPLIEIIASIVLLIVSIIMMTMAALGSANVSAALPSVLLWVSIAGVIFGIILCIVGAVIFVKHAKSNEKLEGNAKGVWIGSLVTLVCFAFPVYWWKCIRKED